VPFGDPSKEDISTYTIGFSDNFNFTGWPEARDTPFMGNRTNVVALSRNRTLAANGRSGDLDDRVYLVEPVVLYSDNASTTETRASTSLVLQGPMSAARRDAHHTPLLCRRVIKF
jgi:hypothetical protein